MTLIMILSGAYVFLSGYILGMIKGYSVREKEEKNGS